MKSIWISIKNWKLRLDSMNKRYMRIKLLFRIIKKPKDKCRYYKEVMLKYHKSFKIQSDHLLKCLPKSNKNFININSRSINSKRISTI